MVYPKNALTRTHICIVVPFHFHSIRCDLSSSPSCTGAVCVCLRACDWKCACGCVCSVVTVSQCVCASDLTVMLLFFFQHTHTPIRRDRESLSLPLRYTRRKANCRAHILPALLYFYYGRMLMLTYESIVYTNASPADSIAECIQRNNNTNSH